MPAIRKRRPGCRWLLLVAGLSVSCAAAPPAESRSAAALGPVAAAATSATAPERRRSPTSTTVLPTATIGRVVRVIDGDTFELLAAQNVPLRVRVAGIDAPEKSQPYSRASREALAALVAGRPVRVDGYKKDPWGRLVGQVFRDDVDIGLTLISQGLAWHFKRYAGEQSPLVRVAYASAENEARHARIGLWSGPDPIAPWEFRSSSKWNHRR